MFIPNAAQPQEEAAEAIYSSRTQRSLAKMQSL